MKLDNNLIKVTNTETGEFRYFTKDNYVAQWCGCSPSAIYGIKSGYSKHFPQFKYEITDGSEIKWKDINIF